MKNTFSLDNSKAKELLPVRPVDGNKGTFGRVLIISQRDIVEIKNIYYI